MRSIIFILSLFLVAGCGKSSKDGQSSPDSPAPQGSGGQESTAPKELQVYEGATPALNQIQAANINQGQTHFDFIYQPQRDEGLTLTSVKPYLIGCQDSDIRLGFNLFHFGSDGNVDFSSSDQLGPAPVFENGPFPPPVLVKGGVKYLLRVDFMLQKNCLGVAYYFGVKKSR